MTDLLSGDICSVAEFLVHALEMETESAERYRELADNMEVHNNPEVAALFRRLAVEGDAHAEQVKRRAGMYELPDIAPWEFKWTSPDAPESAAMDDVHYLMGRREALELALHNEIRGQQFYAQVSDRSQDAEVECIARELAEEEEGHVMMLREWLAKEADEPQPPLEDLDPPNMPE